MSLRVTRVLVWIPVVLCVILASLAFHYRQQSQYYQYQWEGALADTDLDMSEPVPVKSSSPRVVYVKEPAATGPDLTGLQNRIAELELQLSGKEALIVSLRQSTVTRPPDQPPKPMDPLLVASRKTNDIARHAEAEKKREEFQQKIQNSFARQANFLLNRDTSKMSEEEKVQYEKMVGLLDETWKAAAQMQANLPPKERQQVMHTLRNNLKALSPLLATERTREFYDLGVSLGYNETEAAQFVAYIADVIDVTSVNKLFPKGHTHSAQRGGGGTVGQGNNTAAPASK